MGDPLQLTVDCADPDAQVRFWAAALVYVPKPPLDGFDTWRALRCVNRARDAGHMRGVRRRGDLPLTG